ncbi:hypothetical protein GTY44_10760 [Streptomyces sp. SID5914]|nr:acyl-CoA dehydrogenase family protein [Streptomyces sp. SID5914]MZG13968.1 hypothetical protein [Streptomyces sp. SID5914]
MDAIGAFGITEPAHGSDLNSIETVAVRDGDFYILNGTKKWVGNASVADLSIIFAKDEQTGQIAGFVVEKGTPGYDARPISKKIAVRSSIQADIRLTDVRVPVENRLTEGSSFREVGEVLKGVRPMVAWQALGIATGAYEAALDYTLERSQFGRPVAAFQLVQEKLADMAGAVSSMRLMTLRASRLLDDGRLTHGGASLVKRDCARLARRVCRDARDLLGGNGILLDHDVARHFADVEALYTYEGTDHVQSLLVAREITGLSALK